MCTTARSRVWFHRQPDIAGSLSYLLHRQQTIQFSINKRPLKIPPNPSYVILPAWRTSVGIFLVLLSPLTLTRPDRPSLETEPHRTQAPNTSRLALLHYYYVDSHTLYYSPRLRLHPLSSYSSLLSFASSSYFLPSSSSRTETSGWLVFLARSFPFSSSPSLRSPWS